MVGVLIAMMLLLPAAAEVNQADAPVVDPVTGFTHYPEYDDAISWHLEGELLYAQIPPVGGPHNATWQNCGFYTEPIYNWHGVHTLEHGAVWITYDPELPQADIDILAPYAELGHVLITPYPGLPDPVVATSWGRQVRLDGVNDPRLDQFVREFRLNQETSPEPGALCTLGTDQTMLPGETLQIEPSIISGTVEEVVAAEAARSGTFGQQPTSTPEGGIRDAIEGRD